MHLQVTLDDVNNYDAVTLDGEVFQGRGAARKKMRSKSSNDAI